MHHGNMDHHDGGDQLKSVVSHLSCLVIGVLLTPSQKNCLRQPQQVTFIFYINLNCLYAVLAFVHYGKLQQADRLLY